MSFDPITLAMANKYTDEKAGGSGGGTIYLSEYADSNIDLNVAILMLAASGGGTHTFESGMEKFWADVIARQPDYLVFKLGAGETARVTVGGLAASQATYDSGSSVVSAIGILSMYGMNLEGSFVLVQEGEAGVKVLVKADMIEFLDNTLG